MSILSMFAVLALASPPAAIQVKPTKTLEGLKPLAFVAAPSGSKFAVTLQDNSVRIMDASTRETMRVLKGHPQPCYAIAWSKDGALIATGDESARVWIWNVKTGEKIKEFRTHQRGVQHLSFNSTRNLLLSTGKEDAIKIYDLKKGVEIRTIPGQGANFYSAVFNPRTNEFTTGTLGTGGRVYAADGRMAKELVGHDGMGVLDDDYSPSGAFIATAGKDGNVILWDAKKRVRLQTLRGHQDWVENVKFSPNGRLLASGSNDRSVRIWDTTTYKSVGILNEECAVGSPVCWTSDGKYLITVDVNDNLQINSVSPSQGGQAQPQTPKRRHRKTR